MPLNPDYFIFTRIDKKNQDIILITKSNHSQPSISGESLWQTNKWIHQIRKKSKYKLLK
jgi:hypothetical protein